MTPLEIEIVLHYDTRANDYREGDFSFPAVRETLDRFREELHLLEHWPEDDKSPTNPTYQITERGRFYAQALKAVPLPVAIWVMPETSLNKTGEDHES